MAKFNITCAQDAKDALHAVRLWSEKEIKTHGGECDCNLCSLCCYASDGEAMADRQIEQERREYDDDGTPEGFERTANGGLVSLRDRYAN
jgi:hypothetical protein